MSNYNDEVDWSNVSDMSDTLKIVIFAEGNKDDVSFLNGLPYKDETHGKFPIQAHDFAKNNPIIGGKPVEYLVVVGAGEDGVQIKNAFNQVASAKSLNGQPFVQNGTKLFVMGHASPGSEKAGSGGTYGSLSPSGWRTIIQDTGLSNKFDQVAYGSCSAGEYGSCVNLSFAFGDDTEVLFQTDHTWGEPATAGATITRGDFTTAKNPADADGTFADAVHAINSGQVSVTGYDRKQTKFAGLSEAPFELDGDPRLEDIGYAGKTIDLEELAEYESQYQDIATNPEYTERWSGRPEEVDEPEGVLRDVWTGESVPMSTGGGNPYMHSMRSISAERKEFLDEKYGTYDDQGNLTGHSVAIETQPDRYTGTPIWNLPDEDWDEFQDWSDKKTDQTQALYDMVTNNAGAEWIPNESGQGGTVKFNHYEDIDNQDFYQNDKVLEDYGWTFNDTEGTLDVPDYNMSLEYDQEGNALGMFMTTNEGYSADEPAYISEWDIRSGHVGNQYISGYGHLMASSKFSQEQTQRVEFRQGSEWDAYYQNQSMLGRWDEQYRGDIETELSDQGINRPEFKYTEGTMLLDSDDMIPSVDKLVANPGSETDLMLNQDLNMPDRIDAIWSQYKDRNPVALDAFNQASDKLLDLGIEPNTAYWDKLIGLEALSIYAASDNP